MEKKKLYMAQNLEGLKSYFGIDSNVLQKSLPQ